MKGNWSIHKLTAVYSEISLALFKGAYYQVSLHESATLNIIVIAFINNKNDGGGFSNFTNQILLSL